MASPPTPPVVTPHRPSLLAVVRRVSMSLLIAVVVPAVVFYGVFVLAGVWTAIVAALLWSYGAIAWRAVTGRRTSGLLILAALLLTGRTALSAVADSTVALAQASSPEVGEPWAAAESSGRPAVPFRARVRRRTVRPAEATRTRV